jgi:hypothetical protein
MKRASYFAAACLLLLFTTGCPDLGDPSQIADKANESIRPYFPNVRTIVLPEQGTIIALTCSTGTGPELVNQVARVLPGIQGVQQLRTLRNLGALSHSHTYSTLILGFEESAVVYSVDSGQIKSVFEMPPNYGEQYSHECSH